MTNVYYDSDADIDLIRRRRIAVIGYGNQGRAHALNLRDSGCTVRAGIRAGSATRLTAEADGIPVYSIEEASAWADSISILLPDQVHKEVFEGSIRPHLQAGDLVIVAHGFSIHYKQLLPPDRVDVAMIAPVSPGSMMRRLYLEGGGVPAFYAVWQDVTGHAEEVALSYARALGCTRIGAQRTSFAEETMTDLFGEQAVLCGGLPALVTAGFETLVEAGYQPEMAYFECVHQIKLIVDLVYENGVAGMRAAISDTARYGSYQSGPRIIDEHVRARMRDVLRDIQDGTFARRWMAEAEAGSPGLRAMQAEEAGSRMESVGAELRARMTRGAG